MKLLKWFTYLTSWSLIACVIQSILSAVIFTKLFMRWRRNREDRETNEISSQCLCERIYWHAYNLTMPFTPFISIAYWTMVYNPRDFVVDAENIMEHILAMVLLVIDIFVAGHPIRLKRFYYIDIILLIYAVFSYIYYLLGGTGEHGTHYIYTILDWEKPGPTFIFAGISAIAGPIFHVIMWGLYKLRVLLFEKYFNEKRSDPSPSIQLQI
jgi:hypothetical protein